MGLVDITSEMGIKFEILASVDVYVLNICLRRRLMFLFVFTDRYDPKQAFWSVFLVWKAQKMKFNCILWILALMKPKTRDMNQRETFCQRDDRTWALWKYFV